MAEKILFLFSKLDILSKRQIIESLLAFTIYAQLVCVTHLLTHNGKENKKRGIRRRKGGQEKNLTSHKTAMNTQVAQRRMAVILRGGQGRENLCVCRCVVRATALR